jgi:hypothetical protein
MGTDARFSFLSGFMGGQTSTSVIAKTHGDVTGKSYDNDVIELKPIIEAIKLLAKAFGKHQAEEFIKAVKGLLEPLLGAAAAKVFLDAMTSRPVSDKAKVAMSDIDKSLEALDQLSGKSFHKVTPSDVFDRATESSTRLDSEKWRPGTRDAQQPAAAGKGDAQQPGDAGKREPQQIEKADDMTGVAMLLAALLGAPLVQPQTEHTSDTTPFEDAGTEGEEEASHSEQGDAFGIASVNDAASQRDAIDRVVSEIRAALTENDGSNDTAQPAIDDSQSASQIRAALAPDTESDGDDDVAVQQAATDDDQDPSQEEAALASDDEDAGSDDDVAQRTATDDDQDASQQQVATASHPEDAPTEDVDVVEPASVEAVIAQTLGDQAGLAASAPVIPDDGFSFSAFPKPGVPVEVATAAMPAEQLSHEDMPDSGTPESDSTHPDAGSQDVGNAAPSKEHVVHHGDLAP